MVAKNRVKRSREIGAWQGLGFSYPRIFWELSQGQRLNPTTPNLRLRYGYGLNDRSKSVPGRGLAVSKSKEIGQFLHARFHTGMCPSVARRTFFVAH